MASNMAQASAGRTLQRSSVRQNSLREARPGSSARPTQQVVRSQARERSKRPPAAVSLEARSSVVEEPPSQTPPQALQQLLQQEEEEAAPPPAPPPQPKPAASPLLSKLALLASAAMWGSYAPAVRLLYSTDQPPDAAVVMAVRGVLQAGALVAVSLALQQRSAPPAAPQQQPEDAAETSSSSSSSGASSSASSSSSSSSSDGKQVPGGTAALFRQLLSQESPPLWMAALELGLWNFSATALQTVSLQLISATRASFLVQATLLITPLLSVASGYRPSRNVWAGCAVALIGCLLITADEAAADVAAGSWDAAGLKLGGDSAILAAALFYSLGVVRVSGYARSLPSIQLATGKGLVLCTLGLASLAVAAAGVANQGGSLTSLWGGYADPVSWAALTWVGLGPGAVGSFLQLQGQKAVAPAEAQVIFSSKPIWSAGLAWFLLGGEQLGPLTWVGGATLVMAGVLASTGDKEPPQQAQQEGKP